MRRGLAPTLLLAAAALSTGAALPPRRSDARSEDRPTDPHNTPFTECEPLKKLFCNKANQMAENNQFKTWKEFDDFDGDYDELVDRAQGVRYDDSPEDTRTWTYPSQFGRLQRGFDGHKSHHHEPQDETRNIYHGNDELPNVKMVYLRNKDILIEAGKTYYVYDAYIATANPFDYVSVRFLCRAAATAAATDDDYKQEELESQESNELNPLMKDAIGKRDDVLESGEKEIPDTLIFSEEEKGDTQKKLFALWSRMQSLTPKGRKLPARRHSFVFYGRDGALSAETRAALRPPGQPLRWG